MQRVLFKAIESWIIVQDDEAAARIIQDKALSRHISGVVTVDGNKHTLGSLTVGFGGRRPGSRDNRYPDVQVALQIKYRLLKIDLESMQRQVSEFDQKRRDEEQRTRQSTRMADLGALIESSEREVEEMEGALSVQAERATVAHRWVANRREGQRREANRREGQRSEASRREEKYRAKRLMLTEHTIPSSAS